MTDLLAARAQMGTSLAFHIVFAVLGMGLPVLLLITEGLWLTDRQPGLHGSRPPLVQRVRHPLRCRCGLRHDPLFRAGTALADLHALRRWHHRSPLLGGGVRLLHRGHLPRTLSLRLGPPLAARALANRLPHRYQWHGVGYLRHLRQCLDEQSRRVSASSMARSSTSIPSPRCSTAPGSSSRCTWSWPPISLPVSPSPGSTPGGCCAAATTPITVPG